MRILSSRPRARGLFLAAALLVSAAIHATEASAGATTYYACVNKSGAARISKKRLRCRKGESRLSWRSTGAPGRNGLNGLSGAAGRDGVNGKDGANGRDGSNGTNGVDGTNGKDGANGAVAGYATAPTSEGVAFTTATELNPTTIVSRAVPAGSFVANAKVEVMLSDTKAGGFANVECRLLATPTAGGASVSDTSGWMAAMNVAFVVDVAQTTLPLTLAIDSPTEPSTLSLVCWVGVKEAAGGTFTAEANNAAITAAQTTSNS
jgi:hypothetical protein